MKRKLNMQEIIILLSIGLVAGTLSGLVGIGGGIIIVPVLIYFLGFSQQQAQGTVLFMFLFPLSALGVLNYYKEGYVNMQSAITISLTFVVGCYFGSKLAIKFDQEMVRRIFGVVILFIAIKMIFWK